VSAQGSGAGDGEQHRGPAEPDGTVRVRGVGSDEPAGGHVAGGVVAGEDQCREHDEQPVPAKQLHDGHLRPLLLRGDLSEDGALVDRAAHHVTDADQHHAEQEWHAPTPLQERRPRGDHAGHERGDARGEQHAQRHAELRERPGAAAAIRRGVLDGHQHGAAPLPTCRDALQDAQDEQQDRGEDPGSLVGGQQADEARRAAHEDQREHEHRAPSDPVAEVPGQEGAERSEDEADPDSRERQQQPDLRSGRGEEQLREDEARGRAVDEEVVPLDRGADDRGHGDPALGRGHCGSSGMWWVRAAR
jgi:hypothetical protein